MNLTTVLDLAGSFFIVLALALWAGLLFVPAGFAVAGVGVLFVSWLVDRKGGGRR